MAEAEYEYKMFEPWPEEDASKAVSCDCDECESKTFSHKRRRRSGAAATTVPAAAAVVTPPTATGSMPMAAAALPPDAAGTTPPNAADSTPQTALRVMSFNMRVDTSADKQRTGRDRQWPSRREAFMRTVLSAAPHLLGVQEAGPQQAEDLRAALSAAGYEVQVVFRDAAAADEACVIATRPDAFAVEKTGHFWLATPTPDLPSRSPGATYPRVACWAAGTLVAPEAGRQRLLFVNLHLDHPQTEQAERNRVASAQQARGAAEAPQRHRRDVAEA